MIIAAIILGTTIGITVACTLTLQQVSTRNHTPFPTHSPHYMEQSSSLEILHFRLRSERSRAQNFDHPALDRHSDWTLSGCAAQNLFTEMPFRLTFPGILFASVILASIFVAGLGARWEHLTCAHSTPQRRNHKQFLAHNP